jgi:hypothetical protein
MLKMPEVRRRPWFPQRRWDGHAIPGKRLFIPGVGLGYGDLCWLCRLLPLVKTRSQATVGLGVPAGMTEVLTSLQGMDYVVEEPLETDPFDVHMHLATLPGIPGCEFTPEAYIEGALSHRRADTHGSLAPDVQQSLNQYWDATLGVAASSHAYITNRMSTSTRDPSQWRPLVIPHCGRCY